MKRLGTALNILFILALIISVVGCGSDKDDETPTLMPTATVTVATPTAVSGTPTPTYTGGSYTFKVAHGGQTTTEGHKIWVLADELLRQYTDGKVKLEIFPANSLYSDFEKWDALATGALDIAALFDHNLQMAGFMDFQIPWIMFFWGAIEEDAIAHDRRFWDHPDGGKKIFPQTESQGVKIVGVIPSNSLQMFVANSPLNKLQDLKNMKVGSVGGITAIPIDYGGGKQVFIDTAEWQVAYQQGLIDSMVSAPEGCYSTRLYETAKYALLVDLIRVHHFFGMNLHLWNSLPADLQDIIQNKVIPAMIEYAEEKFLAAEQEAIRKLEEEGMILKSLSSEERLKARDDMFEMLKDKGFLANMDQELVKLGDQLREEPYDQGYFYP